MSRLDIEADRLIREESDNSLGKDPNHDAQRVPPRPELGDPPKRVYDYEPLSKNPPPEALPAKPTATTQATTEPAALDEALPGLKLNLEKTLSYAITDAPEYRNRKEDLFLSAMSLLIERHLWGPRFFDTVTTQFTGTPEGGDRDQALSVINELKVTQQLPYGGSVSAGALVNFVQGLRRSTNPIDEPILPLPDSQSAQLYLTGTLPLLRGAGLSAREDLIQAERNLIYAARTFENFRRDFLVTISSQYYDLLRLASEIENRKKQVVNFEWLSKRTEAMANAGRIAYFEVQRAQQQVLFARNDLLNAQELYGAQLDTLKITIGMPTTRKLEVEPSEVVLSQPEIKPIDAVNTSLKYRLDLQNTADQADDARRKVEVAKNGLLPDLNVNADVRVNTDAQKTHAGGDFDLGASSYSAGVTLGVPLDRKIEQIQYRQAIVAFERAKRSLTLERDQISQAVRQSIRQIEQARFTLDLQNRNIEIALKRLRGVLLRLRTLGPRDFIEAQGDLLEARLRRDTALRDLRTSILNFLLNTGQLRVTAEGHLRPPGKMVVTEMAPPSPGPKEILEAEGMNQ